MERDAQRRQDAADRMAAYRERQKNGQRLVPALLWEREIAQLVRLGYLAPDATGDKYAITEALGELFDQVLCEPANAPDLPGARGLNPQEIGTAECAILPQSTV